MCFYVCIFPTTGFEANAHWDLKEERMKVMYRERRGLRPLD